MKLNKLLKNIPTHIVFLLSHYLLGLTMFFLFRVLLYQTYLAEHGIKNPDFNLLKRAFFIGMQFDSVVLGYIIALPMLVLTIAGFTKPKKLIYKILSWYVLFFFAFTFFISAADIPYFNYTFSRLTAVIFEWASDAGIIVSMILEEPSYLIFSLAFLLVFLLFIWAARKFRKRAQNNIIPFREIRFKPIFILFSFLGIFFTFFAMRGRIDSPIRINHSFFCNNSFYNQLGLNPSFTLLKSLEQSNHIKLLAKDEVAKNLKEYLNLNDNQQSEFDISREVKTTGEEKKKNIVLVLMESMSANKMKRFGNTENLTPFFDSLANVSLTFNNMYSAGSHTCNGIFSTLFSFPTVLRERPMSALKLQHYDAIPAVLQNKGYTNTYFTTHSETFDNVGEFLPKNNFNKVVSQKDYDAKYIQNAFGVPDHILFDYAIEEMDELSNKGAPFFTTIMTVSDHGPYIIPDNILFEPKTEGMKKRIVEYSDWSLKHFMESASKRPWFDSTIFVFVADHGVVMGDIKCEIPLSLHHVPLVIYSSDSNLVQPKVNLNYGNQVDVMPTVMGLLNMSYTNQTLGVDLNKTKRPYAFFSSDDKLGCIDDDYFYIYSVRGSEKLHKMKSPEKENVINENKDKAAAMKAYVATMTQAAKLIMAKKEGLELE